MKIQDLGPHWDVTGNQLVISNLWTVLSSLAPGDGKRLSFEENMEVFSAGLKLKHEFIREHIGGGGVFNERYSADGK